MAKLDEKLTTDKPFASGGFAAFGWMWADKTNAIYM
jgi:hypothetical protein